MGKEGGREESREGGREEEGGVEWKRERGENKVGGREKRPRERQRQRQRQRQRERENTAGIPICLIFLLKKYRRTRSPVEGAYLSREKG